MLYWVQVPHNTRYTAVEMQRWSGGMQCMVAVMVVCVYCGYEGGERFL